MTAQPLNRIKVTVSLSPAALKLLDDECQHRGWQRPQTLDEIIIKQLKPEERTMYFAYTDDRNQSCRIYHSGQILPKSQHWSLADSGQDYKALVERIKTMFPEIIIEVL